MGRAKLVVKPGSGEGLVAPREGAGSAGGGHILQTCLGDSREESVGVPRWPSGAMACGLKWAPIGQVRSSAR